MITLPIPKEARPPKSELKAGNHHWLEVLNSDGHSFGLVVLQWNPGVQRWSHSGQMATGLYVETYHWRYVGLCPFPSGE